MSRLTDEEVASMVTTKITSAMACFDEGRRSPDKAALLLEELRRRGSFSESCDWLKNADTQIHRAVMMVFEHHAGNQDACARTWRLVLGNLHSFAEQKGEWRLLDREKSAAFLGEVRSSMRAKEKQSRCNQQSEAP